MGNTIFPALPGLKWSVLKTPQWSTKVQQAVSGKELRIGFYSSPIYRWQLSFELLRQAAAYQELQTLLGFFQARQGKFDSFLYADPTDNAVTTHGFGVGDGTTVAFQLQRTLAGPRTLDAYQGVQPLVTTPRTNVLKDSADLTTANWSDNVGGGAAAPTITPNAGTAPDGTLTADRIYYPATAVSQWSGRRQTFPIVPGAYASVAGKPYVFSVWLRADVPTAIELILEDNPFTTGATITANVTTAWQRFFVPWSVVASSGAGLTIHIRSAASQSARTLYAWGAQLETGLTPTPYIPTGAAAVTANPAFVPAAADGFESVVDLNGEPAIFVTDWQGAVQALPYPRTNLATYSEDLTQTVWSKQTGVTITANAIKAPDGNVTGDKVAYDGTGSAGALRLFNSIVAPSVDQVPYTIAVWIRADAPITLRLQANFGLFVSVNVTQAWQRVLLPTVTGNGSTNVQLQLWSNTSDNAAFNAYVWGLHCEALPIVGRYVPTTSAAVTVTDYVRSSAGLITFAAALAAGTWLTWSGSYFWRVRFDVDAADFENFLYQLWQLQQLTLVSVK